MVNKDRIFAGQAMHSQNSVKYNNMQEKWHKMYKTEIWILMEEDPTNAISAYSSMADLPYSTDYFEGVNDDTYMVV